MSNELKKLILDVPDFPAPGVIFKDITPLLQDGAAFKKSIQMLVEDFKEQNVTKVAGIDSRGFLFATPVAVLLNAGFVPLRKPGKLPRDVFVQSYSYEYDKNSLEMHTDALNREDRVLLIDDVLATGGTASAAVSLIKKTGAQLIGTGFVIELTFLKGREKLPTDLPIKTLLKY